MLRIGPAGWAYKDWNGVVYPTPRPRGFRELNFIARLFNTVEINTSFYRPITPSMARSWLAQVEENKSFRFTAKLWRGFTHSRNASESDEQLVRSGMELLLESERLGALLLQFPWSFRNDADNRQYLLDLRDRFRDYPLVLEVRHSSWTDPAIYGRLEELNIGLCNIDQPLFSRSVKPAAQVTSPLGYVRLHGRNYKSWFTENKYQGERYDYLYSLDELDPWVDRIREIAQSAPETYVITNNHYLGKAVANGLELTSILEGRPVAAPLSLIGTYPELTEFSEPLPNAEAHTAETESRTEHRSGEQLSLLLE